jgi:hypothetical protein
MARKSLLTESEIRRFMKLASMRPLGDERLDKLHEQPEELEMPPPAEEMGAEGDLPPEPEELELGAEEEPVGDEGDVEKEAMLADVVQAVADVLGVDVDVEGAGEEELEEPVEDLPPEPEELEEPLEGGLGPADEEEVPVGQRDMYEGATQEQIVNEVAKRVAARLSKEAKQDEMVDQLAERILQRLTK